MKLLGGLQPPKIGGQVAERLGNWDINKKGCRFDSWLCEMTKALHPTCLGGTSLYLL